MFRKKRVRTFLIKTEKTVISKAIELSVKMVIIVTLLLLIALFM